MPRKASKYLELLPASAPGPVPPADGQTASGYQPFPVDVLPGAMGRFVREWALALGCDAAHLALPALAAAAAAVGTTRTLRLKRGWEEPSVLWTAVVGDRGMLRSPARAKVLAHVYGRQELLLQEYRTRMQWHRRAVHLDLEARRRPGTEPDNPPVPPAFQRIVCGDTSVDALAEALEDNPRGSLVVCPDLGGWLASFARTRARQSGHDLACWREVHRAGTLFVGRGARGGGPHFVPRAAASLTGAVAPNALARALEPEAPAAALTARLLLAMPPPYTRAWNEPEVDPAAEQDFGDLLGRLHGLDHSDPGDKSPHVLTLSPEAKAVWLAYYEGREGAADDRLPAGALAQLEGYVARFALLHHTAERAARRETDLTEVGKDSVTAGVTLSRWFEAEARRIYTALTESVEERETRQLVGRIRARGGRIAVRDLMRVNGVLYRDVAGTEATLDALVRAGLAQWVEMPCQNGRQARSENAYDI